MPSSFRVLMTQPSSGRWSGRLISLSDVEEIKMCVADFEALHSLASHAGAPLAPAARLPATPSRLQARNWRWRSAPGEHGNARPEPDEPRGSHIEQHRDATGHERVSVSL